MSSDSGISQSQSGKSRAPSFRVTGWKRNLPAESAGGGGLLYDTESPAVACYVIGVVWT